MPARKAAEDAAGANPHPCRHAPVNRPDPLSLRPSAGHLIPPTVHGPFDAFAGDSPRVCRPPSLKGWRHRPPGRECPAPALNLVGAPPVDKDLDQLKQLPSSPADARKQRMAHASTIIDPVVPDFGFPLRLPDHDARRAVRRSPKLDRRLQQKISPRNVACAPTPPHGFRFHPGHCSEHRHERAPGILMPDATCCDAGRAPRPTPTFPRSSA